MPGLHIPGGFMHILPSAIDRRSWVQSCATNAASLCCHHSSSSMQYAAATLNVLSITKMEENLLVEFYVYVRESINDIVSRWAKIALCGWTCLGQLIPIPFRSSASKFKRSHKALYKFPVTLHKINGLLSTKFLYPDFLFDLLRILAEPNIEQQWSWNENQEQKR